ncbi:hypothetical protein [Spirosoma flavum]|uniref:Type II toxin-antitoxin system HicA family toxin n=1 Tax=Spirosoma flavum TaxID=2048557 RepID=A0ABW6ATK0_9BACT
MPSQQHDPHRMLKAGDGLSHPQKARNAVLQDVVQSLKGLGVD